MTGNMWGLQERIVAVRSLCGLAQELRSVRRPLQELLTKTQAGAVENFYARTVEASGKPLALTINIVIIAWPDWAAR
jgi:hypothetical protein